MKRFMIGLSLWIVAASAFAGALSGLTDFTSGTTISSSEVNANFAEVETQVTDNASTISSVQTTANANASDIDTLQANHITAVFSCTGGSCQSTTMSVGDLITMSTGSLINSVGGGINMSAGYLEVPNGAGPTVDTAGEISVDTSIADWKPSILFHDGSNTRYALSILTSEIGVAPSNGDVLSYNSTSDELEFTSPSAGTGDVTSIGSSTNGTACTTGDCFNGAGSEDNLSVAGDLKLFIDDDNDGTNVFEVVAGDGSTAMISVAEDGSATVQSIADADGTAWEITSAGLLNITSIGDIGGGLFSIDTDGNATFASVTLTDVDGSNLILLNDNSSEPAPPTGNNVNIFTNQDGEVYKEDASDGSGIKLLTSSDTQPFVRTESWTWLDGVMTAGDDLLVHTNVAITLVSLDCTVTGATTPSVTISVQECASTGTTCVDSGLDATISAANTLATDDSPTDAAIDANDWWGLDLATLTTEGDVTHCTVEYTID